MLLEDLTRDGDSKVRCWGFGGYGALGIGSTESVGAEQAPDSAEYDVVVGQGLKVVDVDSDYYHTCAVVASGGVRC